MTRTNDEPLGVWIRRQPAPHLCQVPQGMFGAPNGQPGDVWRCHCGVLWQVHQPSTGESAWRLAGWWTRWTYRRAGR